MPQTSDVTMTDTVKRFRRITLRRLRRMLRPKFRASGWVRGLGDDRRVMLCTWKGRKRLYRVKGFRGFTEIIGFADCGVMTDAYGGGLCTTAYGSLCLEDLMRLCVFVRKHLAELE